jgi:class 3 adenylate cyclase/tetratricopeptide (TPR) repeat protein
VLDEPLTVRRFAEEGVLAPAFRPKPERWLDLALVLDEGPSMGVWQQAARELLKLLEYAGAFRDVRVWGLDSGADPPTLVAGLRRPGTRPRRSPNELPDSGGRRAVWVLTDCVSDGWQDGRVARILEGWAQRAPVAILQVLPERLWARTALGSSWPVQLCATGPGAPSGRLGIRPELNWARPTTSTSTPVPVVSLEPRSIARLARLTAGTADNHAPGFAFELDPPTSPEDDDEETTPDARERLASFREVASPSALRLAARLAASPVITLPILRLVRRALLPEARQSHESEVLLGGLLRVEQEAVDPDEVRYEFVEGVRPLLLDAAPASHALEVLRQVSAYVEERIGQLRGFSAMLADPAGNPGLISPTQGPFARIAADVLTRLGGHYARLVERTSPDPDKEPFQKQASTSKTQGIPALRPVIETVPKGVTTTYQPWPIDTSSIGLPEDLLVLTERLAENAHDIWARQRLADGWVHGPRRDDAMKRHPCLVPYDELPDSEKQYGRNVALETLKAILALGYTIAPPGPEAARLAPDPKPVRTYQPRPIDTSSVRLPDDLIALMERLAENAHDIWAKQLNVAGWTLGPKRDDDQKQHPCLVPYEKLPESEKEYDRNAAMETLKAILALGSTIAPRPEPIGLAPDMSPNPIIIPDEETALREDLSQAGMALGMLLDVEKKLSAFRERGASLPAIDRELALRLLRLGEPVLAYDVATEGLKVFPEGRKDQRLRQLQALALARIGDTYQANEILEELSREPHDDPTLKEETLGILARNYKDLGLHCQESDPAEAQQHWTRALELYSRAYERTGGYYPGINAAAMAVLLHDTRKSRELAERVRAHCQEALGRIRDGSGSGDEYWLTTTLAEAELILGRLDQARGWYIRARAIGTEAQRFGDLGSTFNQLERTLLPRLGLPRSELAELFSMPGVAVFAGHMVDRPGRKQPRFPEERQESVQAALHRWLSGAGVLIGYASAACGSDILFLETILELGGEVHVVLPYQSKLFRKDSVEIVPGSDWGARFDHIIKSAKVHEVSEHRAPLGGISYDYASMVLRGLALMHAGQLGAPLRHLAVWDGRPGDGPGGTASTVARWRQGGADVAVIDVHGGVQLPSGSAGPPPVETPAAPASPEPSRGPEIVVFLFADVVGFAKLEEPQLPAFEEHFLGMIARLIEGLPAAEQPLHRDTWGDAVYLVFRHVRTAGRFALDLRDRIAQEDWAAKGLRNDLSIRIVLHAGPAFPFIDPIMQRPRFLGSHTSYAARIEPIAPAGQVYASQAFAALAAAGRVADFDCKYVGQSPLHKGYGIHSMYHVRRVVGPSTADAGPQDPAREVPSGPPQEAGTPSSGSRPGSEVRALLFADVAGFSKVEELQLPAFEEYFLGLIASVIERLPGPEQPLQRKTFGDAIFLVFEHIRHAGRFAVELSSRIRDTDWATMGLPGDLSLRIALHAGPVFISVDPVTRRPTYFGAHVQFAARIEPITPPGAVYASREFATIAETQGVTEFVCRYVGDIPLAHGYGVYPVYDVTRRQP